MSRRISLLLFLLSLSFAPAVFGDSLFLSCTPSLTLNGPDMQDTCPAAGLSPGSNVTAIKLYLLADFQDGAQGVFDSIRLIFLPLWDDPNPRSGSCTLENANEGTTAATNTCGFYSGNVNAPGTTFLTAGGDLNAIAAASFQVQVGRDDHAGTADTVTGGNIVEYDFTPGVTTPEPGGMAMVAIAFGGLVALRCSSRSPHGRGGTP